MFRIRFRIFSVPYREETSVRNLTPPRTAHNNFKPQTIGQEFVQSVIFVKSVQFVSLCHLLPGPSLKIGLLSPRSSFSITFPALHLQHTVTCSPSAYLPCPHDYRQTFLPSYLPPALLLLLIIFLHSFLLTLPLPSCSSSMASSFTMLSCFTFSST